MQKLLEVTYPAINTESLLEIVGATPNPEIATEILCGLYEEPKLPSKVQETSGDKKELTLQSFDKWQDRVEYSYMKEKTVSGFFPKNTVKEDITLENFKERQQDWKSGADQMHISLKTGEKVLDRSSCSSSIWLSYTNLD